MMCKFLVVLLPLTPSDCVACNTCITGPFTIAKFQSFKIDTKNETQYQTVVLKVHIKVYSPTVFTNIHNVSNAPRPGQNIHNMSSAGTDSITDIRAP